MAPNKTCMLKFSPSNNEIEVLNFGLILPKIQPSETISRTKKQQVIKIFHSAQKEMEG